MLKSNYNNGFLSYLYYLFIFPLWKYFYTVKCPHCKNTKWKEIILMNPNYEPNYNISDELNLINYDLIPNDKNLVEFKIYRCEICHFETDDIF